MITTARESGWDSYGDPVFGDGSPGNRESAMGKHFGNLLIA